MGTCWYTRDQEQYSLMALAAAETSSALARLKSSQADPIQVQDDCKKQPLGVIICYAFLYFVCFRIANEGMGDSDQIRDQEGMKTMPQN